MKKIEETILYPSKILCSLFLLTLPLSWNAVQTDQQLFSSDHSLEVEVKGFVYPYLDGSLILSPEPHLKTCCIGAHSKADKQILLHTQQDAPSAGEVIVVKGKLYKMPSSENGPLYYMTDVELRALKAKKYEQWGILGGIGVLVIACYFLKSGWRDYLKLES